MLQYLSLVEDSIQHSVLGALTDAYQNAPPPYSCCPDLMNGFRYLREVLISSMYLVLKYSRNLFKFHMARHELNEWSLMCTIWNTMLVEDRCYYSKDLRLL